MICRTAAGICRAAGEATQGLKMHCELDAAVEQINRDLEHQQGSVEEKIEGLVDKVDKLVMIFTRKSGNFDKEQEGCSCPAGLQRAWKSEAHLPRAASAVIEAAAAA